MKGAFVKISRPYSFIILPLLIISASGCKLGPNYKRPTSVTDDAQRYVYDLTDRDDPNLIADLGHWWERFADPVTSDLVQQALEQNTDLKAAAARVLESQALLNQARSPLWPQIDYSFSRDRSRYSFNSPFTGRTANLSTTFAQDISISYIVDFWGRFRRAEEASWRELLASQADQRALIQTIIAQVVRYRINIAMLQRQLQIVSDNTDNYREVLNLVERRYRKGLVESLDVRLSRENLAASQANQAQINQSLQIAQNALDVLLGNRPGRTESLPETLADLPDLEPIPVGLPAYLLDRRPDLIRAEMRLASATARVGMNIAQMFPNLAISAGYGFRSDEFKDLLNKDFEIYSALIQVLQPVFKGGQLRAQVKVSKAQVEQAAAGYAGAVLRALREVEDTLISEQIQKQRLQVLQLRLREALAAEELAWERYQQGLDRLLTVLETQRRRRLAENDLISNKAELWNNRVSLFLALGGDWLEEKKDEETAFAAQVNEQE